MNKFVIVLLAALAGCVSKPVPPAWQANARDALDGFTDAYLKGASAAASAEFARARRESASTGRFDVVAQLELVRCAAQTASLAGEGCPAFAALAADATPAQRAYAAYLAGQWQQVDTAQLPEQHRAVLGGGPLTAVADPLALMVAAGAAFQAGRITPDGIGLAIDTASAQGWRRPLLAWLGVQAKRAEAAGDTAALQQIRRRMALVSETR